MTRTFLFADLRDFTGFVERRGDRAAAELVAAYRKIIRSQIEKAAGAEIKVEGDAMFLVFASAREAIRCAAAILADASSYHRGDADFAMRIGIGIHAGEPVAQDGDFIGGAVNVAARIAAAAGAGQLLISDLVRGLVRTEPPYPWRDLGSVLLKGLTEPIHLFEVLWNGEPQPDSAALVEASMLPRPALPRIPTGAGPMVDREAERNALEARVAALARGQGGTVLLAGEAGIGKSRLLRETFFTGAGAPILYGACGLSEAPPPYEPFNAMLRSILRAPDGETALQRIAPQLLALVPETGPAHQQAAPDRDHLFGAMLRVVRQYARVSPPVMIVEDLHWADEATLALLQFLASEAETTPFLLLGTYRSDELHRRHRLRPILAGLTRRADVTTVALDRLPPQASLKLLQAMPELATAGDPAIAAINARAEGNPLFLEELAQHHELGRDVVPASLAETVLQRLDRAGDSAVRLLRYLAAVGIRADYELLARLIGDENQLVAGARAATEVHLVIEEGDGLVFRHALTREAILGDLMARERRALHREVGEAIEALCGSQPEVAGTIGEHLGAAGLEQRAVPYLIRAGDRALRLHAPDEAARSFEQAAEWAPGGSRDRMLALDGLGRAYARLLHVGKAMATYQEALDLAETVGTAEDVARITMRRTFSMPWGREEYAGWKASWAAAEPLGNAANLARIASGLARRAHLFYADDEAMAWLDRAQAEAQRAGSREAEIRVLRHRAQFEHELGWQAVEEDLVREELDLALAEDSGVLDAYVDLIAWHARDSDANDRQAMLDTARAYAERRGLPLDLAIQFGIPWVSWLAGDWPAAQALWDTVRTRHPDDAPAIYPGAGPIAATIKLEREGPAVAESQILKATTGLRRSETWRGLLLAAGHEANLDLAQGHAQHVLDRVLPILERRPPGMLDVESFALTTRTVLPAALMTADRRPLSFWIDDPIVAAGGALQRAAVTHARAVAALLAGDVDESDRLFAVAAEGYAGLGWRLLTHELSWQRLRTRTPGAITAKTAAEGFYRDLGAHWRLDWLANQ